MGNSSGALLINQWDSCFLDQNLEFPKSNCKLATEQNIPISIDIYETHNLVRENLNFIKQEDIVILENDLKPLLKKKHKIFKKVLNSKIKEFTKIKNHSNKEDLADGETFFDLSLSINKNIYAKPKTFTESDTYFWQMMDPHKLNKRSVVHKSKNSKIRSIKISELFKISKKQCSSVITNLFDYETEKNIRTKRLARFYEKLISDMSKRNKKNFVQTLISSEA